MEKIKECLKLKLEWEKCSTKLIIDDFKEFKTYQEKMNECFKFYKKYKECLITSSL